MFVLLKVLRPVVFITLAMIPLPWRNGSSICLPSCEFYAVLGTAVVITSAATFWCTRRFSRRSISSSKPNKNSVSEHQPPKTPNSSNSPSPASPEVPAASIEDSAFLCTSCGTEKYSPEQLKSVMAQAKAPYKMVILVRTDINMGKGKAAAQCCHAVLAAFKTTTARQAEVLRRWEREGQAKVTLKVESEPEMLELMNKARLAGITAESIRDAGRTQIAAGTRTVCAIGPAPAKLIDTITGHLKLY